MAEATIVSCEAEEPRIINREIYVKVYIYCDLRPEFSHHVLRSAWVPLYNADKRAEIVIGILRDELVLRTIPRDDVAAILAERISLQDSSITR